MISKRQRKLVRRFHHGSRPLSSAEQRELIKLGLLEYYSGPGPSGMGWITAPRMTPAAWDIINASKPHDAP